MSKIFRFGKIKFRKRFGVLYTAVYENLSSSNTAIGTLSLYLNTTGAHNTAIGYNSLWLNSDGYNNTAIGDDALNNNSSGQGNVAIGFEALSTNTTGNVNTAIGAQADVVFGSQINTTLLGHFAKAASSNTVRIGNAAVTVVEGQVAYTYPSDGRFKTNVSEDIKGLDFVMKLRPISYNFQTKKYEAFMNGGIENAKALSKLDFTESENLRHNGFIAQEVEKAAKEAGYKFDGVIPPKNDRDTYGLSYSQFVVPLVKAVQEQQVIIEEQQKQIDGLLRRIELLEKNSNAR
jgi:trimeric autotransporter adhesin